MTLKDFVEPLLNHNGPIRLAVVAQNASDTLGKRYNTGHVKASLPPYVRPHGSQNGVYRARGRRV